MAANLQPLYDQISAANLHEFRSRWARTDSADNTSIDYPYSVCWDEGWGNSAHVGRFANILAVKEFLGENTYVIALGGVEVSVGEGAGDTEIRNLVRRYIWKHAKEKLSARSIEKALADTELAPKKTLIAELLTLWKKATKP